MYIVNGRTCGDIPGKFTCHKARGSSTIDYAIASLYLRKKIKFFNVTAPSGFSDHNLIKIAMRLPKIIDTPGKRNINLTPLPTRYIWKPDSDLKYTAALQTPQLSKEINSIQSKTYKKSQEGLSLLCNDITNLYTTAANQSLKKHKLNKKKGNTKHNKLDNRNYQTLKNTVKSLGKLMQQYPHDPQIRGRYLNTKKNFNKTLKKMKKEQHREMIDKIQSFECP